MSTNRHLEPHRHLNGAFGQDVFGQLAERIARFFGTPQYILGQTLIVILWIALNTAALLGVVHFDPYPYILLNLAFSTQAAYAAPLILLAQTRQAERDKVTAEADARHREDIAAHQAANLELNTELTQQVHDLAVEIHKLVDQATPAMDASTSS